MSRQFSLRDMREWASRENKGFKDWKRNALVSCLAGTVAFFVQRWLYGVLEAMKQLAIAVAVFIATFLMYPVTEFLCNMMRAPRRILEDENVELLQKYEDAVEQNRALKKRFTPNLGLGGRGYEIQLSPTKSAGPCIYLQLVPKSMSQSTVEDCRGFLVGIDQWMSGEWRRIYSESIKLNWSIYGGHSANLVPGAEDRLNLLWCLSTDKGFRLANDVIPLALESAFKASQTFLFNITLVARDCEPVNIFFQAKWGARWDKPLLELTRTAPIKSAF